LRTVSAELGSGTARRLAARRPQTAIVAAVTASLLAMHVGFSAVLALALGLYAATPLLLDRSRPAARA
jgi:hypothetical protein